jgi:hypothetical protein
MIGLDMAQLRSKLDLEGKYVDFSLIRTALTVEKVVRDLGVDLTSPTEAGECRGKCPKCGKDKSFSLNVNTNRFNCFAKSCVLKGGGVIDLVAKIYEVPAKDASHLLACAYGIQPYSQEPVAKSQPEKKPPAETPPAQVKTELPGESREMVSREEFDELEKKVERLSMLVWSMMFEKGEIEESQDLFDDQSDYEFQSLVST